MDEHHVDRPCQRGDLLHTDGAVPRMRNNLRTHLAQLQAGKQRDEGSTLIIVLVVMIIGACFVLPTMDYIMTVNMASRLRIQGANSSEVVRGGLRSVLYDPSALYSACAASGVSDPTAVNLAVPPGLSITTKCTTVSNQQQFVPTDLRWALTTTMAGGGPVVPPPPTAPPPPPRPARA